MIDEIYRVLAPGSRYVTFSLHSIEEVIDKFTNKKYNWDVRAYRVKSSRWNDKNNRRRAVAHTMIVCDKPDHQGNYPFRSLDSVPGVLSEEEFAVLNSKWKKVSSSWQGLHIIDRLHRLFELGESYCGLEFHDNRSTAIHSLSRDQLVRFFLSSQFIVTIPRLDERVTKFQMD